MKRYRNRLTTALAVGLLAGLLAFNAAVLAKDINSGTNAIVVQTSATVVTFAGGSAKSGGFLAVRVAGPNGHIVFEGSSEAGVLDWVLEANLPDGYYNYDAWFTPAAAIAYEKDQARSSGISLEKGLPARLRTHYEPGVFVIEGGVIMPRPQIESDRPRALSLHESASSALQRLAISAVSWLVPAARAEECTDPCTVTSATFPELQLVNSASGALDWEIESTNTGQIVQFGTTSGSELFRMENGAPDNSLYIEDSGDIGFGTSTPDRDLTLVDAIPEIKFDNTSGSTDWIMGEANDQFSIYQSTTSGIDTALSIDPGPIVNVEGLVGGSLVFDKGTDPLLINTDECCTTSRMIWAHSPGQFEDWGIFYDDSTDEMHWQQSASRPFVTFDFGGRVGIGFDNVDPQATLHVQEDGGAKVLVKDTAPSAANRVMFQLNGAGTGKVRFLIGAGDGTWSFNTTGAEFTIGRLGDTETEFLVDGAGNLVVTGTVSGGSSRTIKDQIVPVDPTTVLTKLEQMPIAEWSYETNLATRHVGPMAEDFYAAFGLGPDNKHIAPLDLAGVSLAAIKALETENDALKAKNAELEARLARLETLILK